MRHDDPERILSEEKEILPSSGFVAYVMDAVRREAAMPPPVPFPWKRAFPGAIVSGLAIVWGFIEGIRQILKGDVALPFSNAFWRTVTFILQSTGTVAACWIVLALLLTFASVQLSMLLARRPTV